LAGLVDAGVEATALMVDGVIEPEWNHLFEQLLTIELGE